MRRRKEGGRTKEKSRRGGYSRRFYETVSSSVADEDRERTERRPMVRARDAMEIPRWVSCARVGIRDDDFKNVTRTKGPRCCSSCAERCVVP